MPSAFLANSLSTDWTAEHDSEASCLATSSHHGICTTMIKRVNALPLAMDVGQSCVQDEMQAPHGVTTSVLQILNESTHAAPMYQRMLMLAFQVSTPAGTGGGPNEGFVHACIRWLWRRMARTRLDTGRASGRPVDGSRGRPVDGSRGRQRTIFDLEFPTAEQA